MRFSTEPEKPIFEDGDNVHFKNPAMDDDEKENRILTGDEGTSTFCYSGTAYGFCASGGVFYGDWASFEDKVKYVSKFDKTGELSGPGYVDWARRLILPDLSK